MYNIQRSTDGMKSASLITRSPQFVYQGCSLTKIKPTTNLFEALELSDLSFKFWLSESWSSLEAASASVVSGAFLLVLLLLPPSAGTPDDVVDTVEAEERWAVSAEVGSVQVQ